MLQTVKYSTKPNIRTTAEHIRINRPDAVPSAIRLLKSGHVIAVPTDTVYGLTCDATNAEATHQLYNIKGRDKHKPIAICVGEINDINMWANVSYLPRQLLNQLLPGPVTLILNSVNCNGKIGIRIPNYKFIRDLTASLQRPLALTSANLSNEPSALSPAECKSICDKIPAIFDGGATNFDRSGSTIIDLSERGTYQIVRRGVAIKETLRILRIFGIENSY